MNDFILFGEVAPQGALQTTDKLYPEFVPRLSIYKSDGWGDCIVLTHSKYMCMVLFAYQKNKILVGKLATPFTPDVVYTTPQSNLVPQDIINLIKASADQYEVMPRASYFDEIGAEGLTEAKLSPDDIINVTGTRSNMYVNAAKAISRFADYETIKAYVEQRGYDAAKCAADAKAASVADPAFSAVSNSVWKPLCSLIARYSKMTAAMKSNTARQQQDMPEQSVEAIAAGPIEIHPVIPDYHDLVNDPEVKKSTEEYEATLEDMRQYVNAAADVIIEGKDNPYFTSRGLLVFGKSGTGKTHLITEVLSKRGLKEDVDYVFQKGKTTIESLYILFYEYKDKLIILDDCPNLFTGDQRIAFWKAVAETTPKPVGAPVMAGSKTTKYYSSAKIANDRRARFLKDAGYVLVDENGEETNPDLSRRSNHAKSTLKYVGASYPDSFVFSGSIIVIMNSTQKQIQSEVSKGDWEAIRDRFFYVDVSPMEISQWEVIKKKAKKLADDPNIPECALPIPRAKLDGVISEVERLIVENPTTFHMQWRYIVDLRKMLISPDIEDAAWKRVLQKKMLN